MTKVPDGGQFELWWPKPEGMKAPLVMHPEDGGGGEKILVLATFDREEFQAELDRRLAENPDADYMIVWGAGFEVYEIEKEQI